VVPESVRNRWNEYRKALKESEQEQLGNGDISQRVEMAGWGVEEAEKRNKSEASRLTFSDLACEGLIADNRPRSRYSTCSCLRHPQKLHFYQSAIDRCYNTQGRQGVKILGLEYWKASYQAVILY
jgi:hypothetical protein